MNSYKKCHELILFSIFRDYLQFTKVIASTLDSENL